MPNGIYLQLPDYDREALYDYADREFRNPRDQVALFVHEGLRRAGALPIDVTDYREVASNGSVTAPSPAILEPA